LFYEKVIEPYRKLISGMRNEGIGDLYGCRHSIVFPAHKGSVILTATVTD
jgi:hypothetical protein